MKQIINPFLPLSECIPDGEPHVFGDRIYLFGSHDRMGGDHFCMLPYAVYSAPVSDLSDWTCSGISFRSEQDPASTPEKNALFAPDCVQGNDGRFYLYYCIDGYNGTVHAAVCDTPDGEYEYLGALRNPDGTPYQRFLAFDPAVINDDGIIRLYYGAWFPFENARTPDNTSRLDALACQVYGKTIEEIHAEPGGPGGPVTVTLADDMLTVNSEPKRIMPAVTTGTCWEDHPFFEASSIRKINGYYYFIYSSWQSHELCYAVSDRPDEGFVYRGVLISNGDIGYRGRPAEDRLNRTGNIHGSIECVDGQWYVFYHRQTHRTEYSRQACAEPVTIAPDGSIAQAEMTNCGLNGGPLIPKGTFPAAICCNLTNRHMPHGGDRAGNHLPPCPYLDSKGGELYIRDIEDGTWIGYKYFDYTGSLRLQLTYRGSGTGIFEITRRMDGTVLASCPISQSEVWQTVCVQVPFPAGTAGLFLCFRGIGKVDLLTIELE